MDRQILIGDVVKDAYVDARFGKVIDGHGSRIQVDWDDSLTSWIHVDDVILLGAQRPVF